MADEEDIAPFQVAEAKLPVSPDNPYAHRPAWTQDKPSAQITVTKLPVSPDNPYRRKPVNEAAQYIDENPQWMDQLKTLFKFTGHGVSRGLAETFGFTPDTVSSLAQFVRNHPDQAGWAASIPILGPAATAGGLVGAAMGQDVPRVPGGVEQLKEGMEHVGIPTKTSREEGIDSAWGRAGDLIGEFGGANAPFVGAGAAVKALKGAAPSIGHVLKELGIGGMAPGTGALLGEEIAGPEHEELGRGIGSFAGTLRPAFVEAAYTRGKSSASAWLHDFLGAETGAKIRVANTLGQVASDLPEAQKALKSRTLLPAGFKDQLSVGQATGDEGIIALERANQKASDKFSADLRGRQKAQENIIKKEAQLNRPRQKRQFGTQEEAEAFLTQEQERLEKATNDRLVIAMDEADQSANNVFLGTERTSSDSATVAKNRLSTYEHAELLNARDDLQAVTNTFWNNVDKTMPVDTAPIYDRIKMLQDQHLHRPGQSKESFPTEVMARFFEADGSPRFGVKTNLQDVIDLDSAIQKELREEMNPKLGKGGGDAVRMSYLNRLSESLNDVKYNVSTWDDPLYVSFGQANKIALEQAIRATKNFHDTFSRGPVGRVLGLESSGAETVLPGNTLKTFLTQGPGGIDAFNAFMKAAKSRTGPTAANPHLEPVAPGRDMLQLAEQYVRQDFHDHAMMSGVFNPRNGEQWMANNAGPLSDLPQLRKEIVEAIASQKKLGNLRQSEKQTLDEVRQNSAALWLDGKFGQFFNNALDTIHISPKKQYESFKKLTEMTGRDPTGRATEGLAQQTLTRAIDEATVSDRSSALHDRLDGHKLYEWIHKNRSAIKALDESVPGIEKRFDKIANAGRLYERSHTNPNLTMPEESGVGGMLRNVISQIGGAGIGRHLVAGAGAIQSASIGSNAAKKLIDALTPDQARKVLDKALLDPKFFNDLTAPITAQNANRQAYNISRYFYSIGIPITQPLVAPDGNQYVPDRDRPGHYLEVRP